MKNILFIYPANRQNTEREVKNGRSPDNALYGLNHLKEMGFNVRNKDVPLKVERFIDVLFSPLHKLFFSQIDIDFKLPRALLQLTTINKSDLIVVNTDGIGLAVCLLKRLKLIDKPIIYAIGLFYIKGYLETNINKGNKTFFLNFYKWILSAADQILYHAEVEKEKLIKLGIYDPAKCSFAPIGSDQDFFRQSRFTKIKTLESTVASVGKDRSRDYKTLIEAAKLTPDIKYVLVCRTLNIKGLDIPPNVKVRFNLPYFEVAKIYHQAQVIVIPNKEMNRSSGQMTLTDCLQCEKPIIVSDIKGLAHYPLKDNFNVLKVKAENEKQLKEAIEKLINDKKLRSKLIKNSKVIAKDLTTYAYAKRVKAVADFILDETTIQEVRANDLEYMRNLRNSNREFFFNKQALNKQDQINWYQTYLEKDNDYMFVLKNDNKRVGLGAIYDIDLKKKRAEIGRFIIDKKYRGLGLGKVILDKIEYIAKHRLQLETLYLEVFEDNQNALQLYQNSGYTKLKSFDKEGKPALSMAKNLN